MIIEIVDFPSYKMVDLSIAMLVHQRVSNKNGGLNKNNGDFYGFLLVSIDFEPKTWPLAYKRNKMINDARIDGITW